MKLHNLFNLFAPAVLLLFLSMAPASAAQINGSLPLSGFNTTQNGANLLVSTFASASPTLTSGAGFGDYIGVPVGTDFGGTTLTFATIASGGGYTFTNAAWGTFTATSGVFITHSITNADVFLLGTFTPGPSLATCGGTACIATGTLAHVSINQTGDALSEAITITSPASSLPASPEPATMTLFGSALVGLGLFNRKRFAR